MTTTDAIRGAATAHKQLQCINRYTSTGPPRQLHRCNKPLLQCVPEVGAQYTRLLPAAAHSSAAACQGYSCLSPFLLKASKMGCGRPHNESCCLLVVLLLLLLGFLEPDMQAGCTTTLRLPY